MIGLAGNQPEAEAKIRALGLAVDFIASPADWVVTKPDPAFFRRVVVPADLWLENLEALPEAFARFPN